MNGWMNERKLLAKSSSSSSWKGFIVIFFLLLYVQVGIILNRIVIVNGCVIVAIAKGWTIGLFREKTWNLLLVVVIRILHDYGDDDDVDGRMIVMLERWLNE